MYLKSFDDYASLFMLWMLHFMILLYEESHSVLALIFLCSVQDMKNYPGSLYFKSVSQWFCLHHGFGKNFSKDSVSCFELEHQNLC